MLCKLLLIYLHLLVDMLHATYIIITHTKKLRNKTMKMISRIYAKKEVQKMLTALRLAGLEVIKLDSGYEVKHQNNTVYKAMIGGNGYLVRHADNLFQ
jgi:hypothetical protein